MNIKILIVGLGSIGKRHLKNLVQLGYNDIVLVRRNALNLEDFPNLISFGSIDEACRHNCFTHAIISTPTALHFENFHALSKYEIRNVYIEKPISHDIATAKRIEEISRMKNINVKVGFDLRFDLGLNKVQDLLNDKVIGKICSFQVEVGQYLPDWRPNEDYRKGMSARKDLGGGVMLDLIHEFDYVNWLLGPVDSIFGMNTHISDLDIDTEDVSVNIIKTKSNVLGVVYLDYLQKILSRKLKIVGEYGCIFWDYKDSIVEWYTHKDLCKAKFQYGHSDRNERFKSILSSFMQSTIDVSDPRLSSVYSAVSALELVVLAKKSNNSKYCFDL